MDEKEQLIAYFKRAYNMSDAMAETYATSLMQDKKNPAYAGHLADMKQVNAQSLPPAPITSPLAAPTPEHVTDSNLSSWQQLYQMFSGAMSPRDAASGMTAGAQNKRGFSRARL